MQAQRLLNYTQMLITLILISLWSSPWAFAQDDENVHPLTAAGKISPYQIDSEQIFIFEAEMDLPKGYKAFEDQFKVKVLSPPGFQVLNMKVSPVHEYYDKFTKKNRKSMVEKAKLSSPIEAPKNLKKDGELTVQITYQACTEKYCLFPENLIVTVPFKVGGHPTLSAGTASGAEWALSPSNLLTLKFEQVFEKGLLLTFIFVFVFGFLTSFTPCVYPMIPITLAVLGREAHARSRAQNFLVSIVYVLGIAVTYSLLGVLAATTGALFGSFMAHPLVLGALCVILLAMSLSLFGLFEMQAPQFLRDGILSHLKVSGYFGAFVSGLLAGVIASPCVGPVLVGILTFVAQSKNVALGFWLLFVYALGMGMIFLALGLFSDLTKKLPKSGRWLSSIKIVLGLFVFAAFLYYLNLLFPFNKFMTSERWIKEPSELAQMKHTSAWITYSEAAVTQAQTDKKPVIIDFRADWCAACIELEQYTFSRQEFLDAAKDFTLLKFDATSETPELAELRKKYSIVGLPSVVFLAADGTWIKGLTLTQFEEIDPFLARMGKAKK